MARRFAHPIRIAGVVAALCGLALTSTPCAFAADVAMAPKILDQVTPDGLNIHMSTHDEVVNSIPNLADAANSREAFVTLTADASVGGASAIQDSLFIMGYQLGCQSDVSSGLQFGGAVSGGLSGTGTLGTSSTLAGSAGAGATGYMQTVLEPGVIVDLPMSNMALSPNGHATLDITGLHIKADACGGDVTIRSYAYLRVSTADAHSSYAIYGDPIKI